MCRGNFPQNCGHPGVVARRSAMVAQKLNPARRMLGVGEDAGRAAALDRAEALLPRSAVEDFKTGYSTRGCLLPGFTWIKQECRRWTVECFG
jgi:hypothetical protein